MEVPCKGPEHFLQLFLTVHFPGLPPGRINLFMLSPIYYNCHFPHISYSESGNSIYGG
jgi:hypothetical protein